MKIFNVKSRFLWIFLLLITCKIFSQEQNYIPYRKGKLWGLCDSYKRIVVQPQYYSISSYDGSVGGFHAEKNGKFGIIDQNATQIMPFISEGKPITVSDENYVVFDGFDFYNYSIKTKMRMDRIVENPPRQIEDMGFSNKGGAKDDGKLKRNLLDDEDLQMILPFDNNSYQINYKVNCLEIVSGKELIGIYVPKLKKIFRDTSGIAYIDIQPYNGKFYILTTDSSGLFGLVDENLHEIYPIKYTSISLMNSTNTVILSEPDPKNPNQVVFKTILPNDKILEGEFYPENKILKDEYPFQLYYKIVEGQKNYAGEDGTLYFEG
ncbi:hypothetical protein [Chryseobacterium sp. MMS23-Vi53]|uniref:hypothetical protein n=1 Tax=Chryseobacterium sp. MMS23-Vi53 TaxID=3386644 RepID=UPI0039E74B1D